MESVPTHVAIIPDGNRRWARQYGKTPVEGHTAGVLSTRAISTHAADRGVKHLSLWGMSLDNFKKRSKSEVVGLLSLFKKEFTELQTSDDIHNRQVKINVIGRWREKFPRTVQTAISEACDATKDYTRHYLNFFLAYNGTDEMLQAVQQLVNEAKQDTVEVTGDMLKQHLMTRDLPPVDLLIRTGGEPHLSTGFMMWDIADAELQFSETFWPAFTPQHFDEALAQYNQRERRFGK